MTTTTAIDTSTQLPAGQVQRADEVVDHLTDFGNAARFVLEHGRRVCYCWPWKQWLVWDGTRWSPDRCGRIETLGKLTVRNLALEAAEEADDGRRRELLRHALASETDHRLQAMIRLARSDRPVLQEVLDADPMLFNVLNGTLDLRTGTLRPHDPVNLITKLAPVTFDPEATCPRWRAFLDRVLHRDQELQTFVQRAVGYTLTGETIEEVLFFLFGTGMNGKTKLLEVLARLLGDYFAKAAFTTFLTGHRSADAPRDDLADLAGARLVTAVEASEGVKFAEGFVKEVTGGDTVKARKLYADLFQFRPSFKLWLGANHKPTMRGTDLAMWRRVRLIPFIVTIPEAERDTRLLDKLSEELPGILNWALAGCLAWQRDGLGLAPAVREATEAYRVEQDVLAGFLEEACVVSPNARATAGALYVGYRRWCERTGETPIKQTGFGLRLGEHGFVQIRTGRARYWVGLGVNQGGEGDAVTGSNPESRNSLHAANLEKIPETGSPPRHCVTTHRYELSEQDARLELEEGA